MNILSLIAADTNIAADFRAAFREPSLPKPIRISVGTYHPQDCSILEWEPYHFTRAQAAKALRYCRREKFRIEADRDGYVVSEVCRFERDEMVYLARNE